MLAGPKPGEIGGTQTLKNAIARDGIANKGNREMNLFGVDLKKRKKKKMKGE